MSFDTEQFPDVTTIGGKLVHTSADGTPATLSLCDGKVTSDAYGNITLPSIILPAVSSSVIALENNATIPTTGAYVRTTASAAVTGIILAPGTRTGQEITILHNAQAADSITFDASTTSNVADGNSDVIPGLAARSFIYDDSESLWYPIH